MVILALALGASGCVSAIKQSEVQTAMRDVGFTEADARCIASRAGRRMSISQLRSLQRAASSIPGPIREAQVGEVIDAIRNNVDADTLSIVATLASECVQARMQVPTQ